jgi:hypothetical protein
MRIIPELKHCLRLVLLEHGAGMDSHKTGWHWVTQFLDRGSTSRQQHNLVLLNMLLEHALVRMLLAGCIEARVQWLKAVE